MTVMTKTNSSPIQKYYAGQNVFITGGTGFLGKILIEKLLRSCPDIASIYVLVRPKKGLDVYQRIDNMFDDVIFQRLKHEIPKFRYKVVPIVGDCALPGLGLSPFNRETLLNEISIVFNVAATVRFDEKIQNAVAINIQGTKETLNLCRYMINLTAIIHVSTAYSNCIRNEIDEKFYDSPMTGDELIKLVQSSDKNELNAMVDSLLDNYPNTYTYTKQIAEQIVLQYGKDLPIGIFRPAIIISSYKEPLEGWIDNIYGPVGLIVGCGVGLVRTINLDKSCTAELVPVDYTVNALIATAWDITSNKNEVADPPIYNYISTWNKNFTWGEYIDLAIEYGLEVPSVKSIWCFSITPVANWFIYYILTILLHIIPGLLIDIGLLLSGKQIKILKTYKKIHKVASVTTYFSTREWQFKNDTTKSLWKSLTDEDKKLFYFSLYDFDWRDYMKKSIIGLRVHILSDELNTIEIAKKRMIKFQFFHYCIKYGFMLFTAYVLYYYYSYFFIGKSCIPYD